MMSENSAITAAASSSFSLWPSTSDIFPQNWSDDATAARVCYVDRHIADRMTRRKRDLVVSRQLIPYSRRNIWEHFMERGYKVERWGVHTRLRW